MLVSIRLSLLLLITVPAFFLASALSDGYSSHVIWSTFMNGNYDEQWKAVDKALDEGLPKTALEMVEKIYSRAKSENNQPQIVKAAAYRVALLSVTNEEDEVVLVRDLEKEIAAADQPGKAVLTSMMAELYWNYYQMNRWRIHDRSEVNDAADADFRTWNPGQFFDTTKALYVASLAPAEILQSVPVDTYDAILIKQSESGKYRPTLYDILAHRALDFFRNDQADLPVPQADFELEGLEALTPAADFVRHAFTSPNPRNTKYQALLIYQQLLRFHAQRGDADALVDLDLQRLAFSRAETLHEDKDTTYFLAIEKLYTTHASAPISTLVGAEIARYHYDHDDYVTALSVCERESARFPASRGATDCRALRSSILAKELSLAVETTTRPDAAFLMSAGYRNVDRVHFRIVQLLANEDDDYLLRTTRDVSQRDRLEEILRRGSLKEWSQELPKQTDYKSHLVDLRGPELPAGVYMIFMSPREDFSFDGNAIAYTWLRVTRLSLENIDSQGGEQRFWVTDAAEGAPLKSVKVRMYSNRWNSSKYEYERVEMGSVRTGPDGLFVLEPGRFREGVSFQLSVGRDTLTVRNSYNAYERGRENTRRRTLFFTDRAIYRPGQTLYLKGILTEGSGEKADFSVLKNTSTTVTFFDANNQKVHEAELRSNDYGSFNTTFTLPSGVLTGVMYIRNEWGSTSVRVEEYKRPKFEVAFKPVEGEYRLNTSVKVTGEAKAYAGSNVDGATVNWRVVRRVRYPYWFWWWRPAPRSDAQVIGHGSTTTDADGAFAIDFTALPDRSVDPKSLPVFTYEVSADVVDVNGETHSATTAVSAGYTSVALSLGIPEMIDATKEQELRMYARNLGGQPIAASGTLRIETLTPPDRVLRARALPAPDSWVMSKEDFSRAFPHDVYKDENLPDTWEARSTLLETKFSTGDDGTDSLVLHDLAPGAYRITMSAKDPGGQDLVIRKTVTVYRPGGGVPSMMPEFYVGEKTSAEPGEEARFLYGSAYDGVSMMARVEDRSRKLREGWSTEDAGQRSFRYRAEESQRGGYTVQVFFVKHYRLYQQTVFISVPWSNKQLQVETATFRDKLEPGAQEEWRITIKGPDRERIAAEVLASMYDASLDAIYRQEWGRFSWPSYGRYSRFSNYGFGGINARLYVEDWNEILSGYSQNYDRLNLFLLNRYGRYYGRRMYMSKSEEGGLGLGFAADRAAPAPAAMVAMEEASNGARDELVSKKVQSVDDAEEEKSAETGDASSGGLDAVKARTNFNETAFFYPDLMTDEEGNVLRFTAPEALTRWKLRVYAHTPDLKSGYLEKTAVTQKELMVMPNMPRFLRNGDDISLMTKVSNLSDTTLTGSVTLKLFDAVTMQPVDARFGLADAVRPFTVEKGRSTTARWDVHISRRPESSPTGKKWHCRCFRTACS